MPFPPGNYRVMSYESVDGRWRVRLENALPGPGLPTDYFIFFALDEIPANMNPQQTTSAIRDRLLLSRTFPPFDTAVANNLTINIP